MRYHLLTVNREFGSGGGSIAQAVAKSLGWKLLDKDIIDAIAYAAHVDARAVQRYDEHVESWLSRINQQAMRTAALTAGLELGENAVFDAEGMAKISQKIIEHAYAEGSCVIVGRGSQCILQHKPDAFHAFIYAPLKARILRLRTRLDKGVDIEDRIRKVDGERARYLQQFFGKSWCNLHLYDLMISSQADEAATARVIQFAMSNTP